MNQVSNATSALTTDRKGSRGGSSQSDSYRGPWTMTQSAGSDGQTGKMKWTEAESVGNENGNESEACETVSENILRTVTYQEEVQLVKNVGEMMVEVETQPVGTVEEARDDDETVSVPIFKRNESGCSKKKSIRKKPQPKKVKNIRRLETKTRIKKKGEVNANVSIAEIESKVCSSCGGSPCYWLQFGCEIVEKTKESITDDEKEACNLIRKKAYKFYTFERYGILGKYNRIQVPNCILESIRREWPDEAGLYMGFRKQ